MKAYDTLQVINHILACNLGSSLMRYALSAMPLCPAGHVRIWQDGKWVRAFLSVSSMTVFALPKATSSTVLVSKLIK